MDHTHIVQASDLEQYANRRDSQATIPELLYWLISSSISQASICRIPYGDVINQPGWDGIVKAGSGFHEFVPNGMSYWEIGTGANPQKKATEDFRKRSKSVSESQQSDSSYVFVTPRVAGEGGWSEPEQTKWLNRRRNRAWKEIRVIDGVKLADWLREFPAIGLWLAKKIGLSASLSGLSTPSQHWETVQNSRGPSDPILPPDIFIAGRENACTALRKMFEGHPSRLLLSAESGFDVKDFVAAFLVSLDNETTRSFSNRCLFISEEDAWRAVVHGRSSHVLVADPRLGLDTDQTELQTIATSKGHSVIIPICGAHSDHFQDFIKLRSPSESKLERILLDAKYPMVRARELASVGSYRLSALRRFLLGLGTLPPYATWDNARALALAGLGGRWEGNNTADQCALEQVSGLKYGEWIEKLKHEILRTDTPLIQYDQKWRMVVRGEAWRALGHQLFDEDLDRFQESVLHVLGERNPEFDLPSEERYAASIHGKALDHSVLLREGMAETLALLGSQPDALSSCSHGKASTVAVLAVRGLLDKADWERWASLNHLLPLIAEAAPDEFLNSVELALEDLDRSPFSRVFAEEGTGGIGGQIYTSGLLWALETLAWHSDYLTRVVLVLGNLASIDPGGTWSNRPSNSLVSILLPWHVQTCASIDKRRTAVRTLLRQQPKVCWDLLIELLPGSHTSTSGCHRPSWRNFIDEDWKEHGSHAENFEQVKIYAGMAIETASDSTEKLSELVSQIAALPEADQHMLLSKLDSVELRKLPEEERLTLWERLDSIIRNDRRERNDPESGWAIPERLLTRLKASADGMAPRSAAMKSHHLFPAYDSDLYEEKGDYDEQSKRFEQLRQSAIQGIVDSESLEAVFDFARIAPAPRRVGYSLGYVASDTVELELLPGLLLSQDEILQNLISGYVLGRFHKGGVAWLDALLANDWSVEEIASFFLLLPCREEVWTRAEKLLGKDLGLYWNKVEVNPWGIEEELTHAVERLLEFNRSGAGLQCLQRSIKTDEGFNPDLAARCLLALLDSNNMSRSFDHHAAIDVITELQNCQSVDINTLFEIEFKFLPLLGEHSRGAPKTLEYRLASDATFYCKVISAVFPSKNGADVDEDITEHQRDVALNAYKLLTAWKIIPGTQTDGSFASKQFLDWLSSTREIASNSGHLDRAFYQLGETLIHAPEDPDGFWIHRTIAQTLDAQDSTRMRHGYYIGKLNQRGAYHATGGTDELKIAHQYRDKAEATENEGYIRLATLLREIAKNYELQAESDAAGDPYED